MEKDFRQGMGLDSSDLGMLEVQSRGLAEMAGREYSGGFAACVPPRCLFCRGGKTNGVTRHCRAFARKHRAVEPMGSFQCAGREKSQTSDDVWDFW